MNWLLIGGVPSSGSSFLVRQLSRRDSFLCLPETGLFCHGQMLVGDRARTDVDLRWRVPWVDTDAKVRRTLGWTVDVGENHTASAWDIVRAHLPADENRTIVEKCPENVFAFDVYLRDNPTHRVVLTSRGVEDVCVSLARRGFGLLEALLIWVAHSYETWRLLTAYPEQVLHCRFDSLIAGSKKVASEVAEFGGPTLPMEREPGAIPNESLRTREQWLLDLATLTLEDTAWSHRAADSGILPRPTRWLGLEFTALVESTGFLTREHGLVGASDVEAALRDDRQVIEAVGKDARPLQGAWGSPMTTCLAQVYRPHVVGKVRIGA